MMQSKTYHDQLLLGLAENSAGVPSNRQSATGVRGIAQSIENYAYITENIHQVVIMNKNHIAVGCSLHNLNYNRVRTHNNPT